MGSDVLAGQGGAGGRGGGCVALDAVLDGVLAHGRAAPGGEQGAARPAGVFAEPCGQDGDGVAEQRCHPVFPALAVAFQVGAVAQVGVGAGEAGQFAGAQAGSDGGQQ